MTSSGKVRIYELSKDLGLENKDVLDAAEKLAIAAKSHSSCISDDEASRIRSLIKGGGNGAPAAAPAPKAILSVKKAAAPAPSPAAAVEPPKPAAKPPAPKAAAPVPPPASPARPAPAKPPVMAAAKPPLVVAKPAAPAKPAVIAAKPAAKPAVVAT